MYIYDMQPDTSTLLESPEDLRKIIADLQGRISNLKKAHDKEIGILLEQIQHLRAQLFGSKSEKTRSYAA